MAYEGRGRNRHPHRKEDASKVRDVLKRLNAEGYYLDRTTGDHRQFKYPDLPNRVTVPGHPSDDVDPKTLKSIYRRAGLGATMSNTATIEVEQASQIYKTPGTRLLDLLAGLGRFVDGDNAALDAGLDAFEIGCMYQEAAAEVFELQGDAAAEAVRRWVLERILPALLR